MTPQREMLLAMRAAAVQEKVEMEAQFRTRLQKLDSRIAVFDDMLAEEAAINKAGGQLEMEIAGASPAAIGMAPGMGAFLRETLSNSGRFTLTDLVARVVAKGGLLSEAGLKSPGRAVHFALVGLQKHNYVRRNEDGTWSGVEP